MVSSTTQHRATGPSCPSCGARQRLLVSRCRSCSHEYTPREILLLAGALLEDGMPRRSVRRQIAESAKGRVQGLMEAARKCFGPGSQGTRLACLMAAQDFGEPRAMPPGLLARHYDGCAPAVQAEIVLNLARSETEEAEAAIARLRGRANDPRVLEAFEDPFFRSEVLTIAGEWDAGEAVDEDEDEGPEVEIDDEAGEDWETMDGFEPVEVVNKSVPPPFPGQAAEPAASRTSPPPLLHDMDVEHRRPATEPPSARMVWTYVVLLALLVALGAVTVAQFTKHGWRREEAGTHAGKQKPLVPPVPIPKLVTPGVEDLAGEAEQGGAEPVESHILSFEATATSEHRKYPASNVGDGNPSTVWQEAKGEKPLRKVLTLSFAGDVTITRIGVLVGYDDPQGRHGDMWKINNRLKRAEMAFSDGKVMFLDFEDSRQMQYFDISPPHRTNSLEMTILDVYKGTWFYDNAVAEIEVWGYEEPPPSD